jgi:hypothetical protein
LRKNKARTYLPDANLQKAVSEKEAQEQWLDVSGISEKEALERWRDDGGASDRDAASDMEGFSSF